MHWLDNKVFDITDAWCNHEDYFQINCCSLFLAHKNVYQFTCTEQKAPDNTEVASINITGNSRTRTKYMRADKQELHDTMSKLPYRQQTDTKSMKH